jgi:hypothetical protein
VSLASTGNRYIKQIEDEERRGEQVKAEKDREVLQQRVEAMLGESPVAQWMRAGLLPDYIASYRRLLEIRGRVTQVFTERTDLDDTTKSGILQQLGYMLTTYLSFVRERVAYLQILANIRPASDAVSDQPPAPPLPAPQPQVPVVRRDSRLQAVRPFPQPAATLPSVEKRLGEVAAKCQALKDLAQKEPATAKTREWHIGILEKQRDLLLECQKRDQMVVAQLGAFIDVFEVILGRVSASQFSATEVASYMGAVVDQIVETERFVDSLRPAMDQLVGGMGPV